MAKNTGLLAVGGLAAAVAAYFLFFKKPRAKWKVGDKFNVGLGGEEPYTAVQIVNTLWDSTYKQWSYLLRDLSSGDTWAYYYLESQIEEWYQGPIA